MKSPGFRKVPNWLFFSQVEKRRKREEPFTAIEAWCSMDRDLYRPGRLASERAYAADWKRSRDWVRRLMRRFREEQGLPDPTPGRRANGGLPATPESLRTNSRTDS